MHGEDILLKHKHSIFQKHSFLNILNPISHARFQIYCDSFCNVLVY